MTSICDAKSSPIENLQYRESRVFSLEPGQARIDEICEIAKSWVKINAENADTFLKSLASRILYNSYAANIEINKGEKRINEEEERVLGCFIPETYRELRKTDQSTSFLRSFEWHILYEVPNNVFVKTIVVVLRQWIICDTTLAKRLLLVLERMLKPESTQSRILNIAEKGELKKTLVEFYQSLGHFQDKARVEAIHL